MTSLLVQNGETIKGTTPAGGYTSGELVVVTDMVGVSTDAYAENDTFVLITEGVHSVAKVPDAANVFTQGDSVYVTGADLITNVSTSNTFVGMAWEAATTTASFVKVKINWGTGA